jgi:hypothetical protein
MPEKFTNCPSCATRLKVADTLPTGTAIQCPRCTKQFPLGVAVKVPAAPAAAKLPLGKPSMLQSAAPAVPTKAPAGPSTPKSPGSAAPATRMVPCPKCKLVLRVSATPKPGTMFKCPRCATPFRLTPPAPAAPNPGGLRKTALPAASRQTRLAARRRKTILVGLRGRMLVPVLCPLCKVVMKTPVMPLGTPMQCGRCRKAFAMPPVTKPGANGAANTRIVTNRPKTMLAPRSQPRYRIVCQACRTVMHGRGAPPLGRKLKCLKCQKALVLRQAPKPAAAAKTLRPRLPAPTRPGAPVGRLAPKRSKSAPKAKPTASRKRPIPRRGPWWPHLVGLLLTLVLVGTAAAFRYRLGPFEPAPIPEAAWKTFTLPDGAGTIDGPGDFLEREARARGPAILNPRRFTTSYPNVDPGTVDVVSQFRVPDDATFLITYSERRIDGDAPNDFDTIYRQERDYVAEYVKGELQSEVDVTVARHAAREFHLDMGKRGPLVGRVIRVEGAASDRIFILVAAGNHLRFVPGDVERFFRSFEPAAP